MECYLQAAALAWALQVEIRVENEGGDERDRERADQHAVVGPLRRRLSRFRGGYDVAITHVDPPSAWVLGTPAVAVGSGSAALGTGFRNLFSKIAEASAVAAEGVGIVALWKTLVASLSRDGARTDARPLSPSDFRAPRRMKEGYLWGESLIMPRPCTIRDMSPLTAQIVLWHDDIKPQYLARPLKLYSSSDRQEADCIVTGSDNNILSLRFTSALRPPTRKYP